MSRITFKACNLICSQLLPQRTEKNIPHYCIYLCVYECIWCMYAWVCGRGWCQASSLIVLYFLGWHIWCTHVRGYSAQCIVYASMEAGGQYQDDFLNCSPPYFLRQGLSLNLDPSIPLDWLIREPRALPVCTSLLSMLGLSVLVHRWQFSMGTGG